jgi:hypothetical protein
MANGKPGRPRKDFPLGHGHYAGERAERGQASVRTLPKQFGVDQPEPDSRWCPVARGWWKALGISDTARCYQPIDWANAWVAATVLDQLETFGYSAGLFKEWCTLADRLHAPRLDLLDLAEPEVGQADADEDEAEAAVTDIRAKFKVVE